MQDLFLRCKAACAKLNGTQLDLTVPNLGLPTAMSSSVQSKTKSCLSSFLAATVQGNIFNGRKIASMRVTLVCVMQQGEA